MNHLANLFLARDLGEKTLGCLIGEIVRTSNTDKYNDSILSGIELNTKISKFVKSHPACLQSKSRLPKKYSKHAQKVVDIFYDHFLAANWEHYADIPLAVYAQKTYEMIKENDHVLPYKLKKLVHVMIEDNWLVNYSSVSGIHKYMQEMTKRDTFQTNLEYALEELINNYQEFKNDFELLFTDLQLFVNNELESSQHKSMLSVA